MNHVSDHWFIRYPDGRVVRAASTTVVRQQVHSGKIPLSSSVRRTADDEWAALEWTREFADLISQESHARESALADAERQAELDADYSSSPAGAETGGLSARLDRTRLPTVGVRGMMHELLAALDSTLARKKLAAAALAGLCGGIVLACAQLPAAGPIESAAPWARWVVAGAAWLILTTATAGMLTRMTFTELSRMRPARWREGLSGLAGTTFRIAVALLLTAGAAWGVVALLRLLPGYLLDDPLFGNIGATTAAGAAAVGLIFEIALWPIIGFALLLPPILVVEGCSVGDALGHWLRLLRVDLGRVFLYEALALGLGLAATLLLALPWLALFSYQPDPRLLPAVAFTRSVLAGFVVAPVLAYLMVANVFIYINLRYESGPSNRR